ncbi:MAG TPA: hypothetical protein VLB27_06825 [candidate division Zixibacteria bacterium]|nr:hypothetical protein [candidate division Zixibacteria bacterium]
MELYFGSHFRPFATPEQKTRIVTFEIPELGIGFKAPFEGDNDQTDFASLLALLEFVDLNRKLFADKALQIFGANLHVVEQINAGVVEREECAAFVERALKYREKYRYSLEWTPSSTNPALRRPDLPPSVSHDSLELE